MHVAIISPYRRPVIGRQAIAIGWEAALLMAGRPAKGFFRHGILIVFAEKQRD
tara:strand:- start:228 stop:386 length:159 start_codon:yes stop_codon:yes gene_type:complete